MKDLEVPKIERFNISWLSLTYQCNNKCVWCYAGSQNALESKDKIFDRSRLEDTLDLLRDLKVQSVLLVGGEPSLYPHIEDVVQQATNRGIGTHLVTNGRRAKDINFTRRLKAAGLKQAGFSIEGSNAMVHDYTTQVSGSYVEAMQGLENFLSEGITSAVTTVISRINEFDLNNMIDNTKRLGLKHHNFNLPNICIGGNNEHMMPMQESIKIYSDAYRYGKTQGIVASLLTPAPKCLFEPDILDQLKKEDCLANSPCQLSLGNNFVIDWNGDVVPCTHLTGYPMFNIFENGKVMSKDEFIENMNTQQAQLFRSKLNRYAIEECGTCDEKCSGGCPLYWLKYKPSEVIPGKPKLDVQLVKNGS